MLRVLIAERFAVPWSSDNFIHDVRKPLRFADSSVGEIYASRVLEDLHFEEAQHLLTECFRVLQPGGVVRMVVPSLLTIVREYLGEKPFGDSSSEMATLPPAGRLNQRLLVQTPDRAQGGYSDSIML